MFSRDCVKFFSLLTVLVLVFGSSEASRQAIKDILTVVQRIEEKLGKEDRLREITGIVHLDASVDKINKKLDGVLSLLESGNNEMALPRISDGGRSSSFSESGLDASSDRLDNIDSRLERLEKLAAKIASGFENADFGKIAAVERMTSQLQSDMNKKLQKMMNVITSLYEMNKDIKTNFGSRSSGGSFESMSNPGLFIIENLDELERKIKEQVRTHFLFRFSNIFSNF